MRKKARSWDLPPLKYESAMNICIPIHNRSTVLERSEIASNMVQVGRMPWGRVIPQLWRAISVCASCVCVCSNALLKRAGTLLTRNSPLDPACAAVVFVLDKKYDQGWRLLRSALKRWGCTGDLSGLPGGWHAFWEGTKP